MVNTSYFLPRTVKSIGSWGYKKISVKYQNVCESIENIVTKVTSKQQAILEKAIVQNVSESSICPRKNVQQYWKPGFTNYKTTLKENAIKAQKKLLYCDVRARSFFSKDFMWRRPRKNHLLAFAGLFLYQEDMQEKILDAKKQYEIYDRICADLKSLFPSESTCSPLISEEEGNSLNDYKLELPISVDTSGTTYDAALIAEESELDDLQSEKTCSEFDFCESSIGPQPMYQKEISVKAFHSVPRYESPLSVLNYHDSELACCGRGRYTFHNGTQPRKKDLPQHDNIIHFEKVFFGNLNQKNESERFSSDRQGNGNHVLFAVTKRCATNLSSYMDKREVGPDITSILFLQTLEALAHLEAHHFVHRDITPDNVMLDFDETGEIPHVILSGFGQCFGGTRSEVLVPFEDKSLDTRFGKPHAIPPEISRAKPAPGCRVDYTKCDVWMAGVVLYQLLTGSNLFHVDGLDSRTYRENDLPDLTDVHASRTVKNLARSLLSVDPAKRPTAREAADIMHFDIFAVAPVPPLDDAALLSNLRSWAVSHFAEAIVRKKENPVLYKVCENFFKEMNPDRMMKAFDMWIVIN